MNENIDDTNANKMNLTELGWRFNNELILLTQELQLLNETKEKQQKNLHAIRVREEGLNEIRKFLLSKTQS